METTLMSGDIQRMFFSFLPFESLIELLQSALAKEKQTTTTDLLMNDADHLKEKQKKETKDPPSAEEGAKKAHHHVDPNTNHIRAPKSPLASSSPSRCSCWNVRALAQCCWNSILRYPYRATPLKKPNRGGCRTLLDRYRRSTENPAARRERAATQKICDEDVTAWFEFTKEEKVAVVDLSRDIVFSASLVFDDDENSLETEIAMREERTALSACRGRIQSQVNQLLQLLSLPGPATNNEARANSPTEEEDETSAAAAQSLHCEWASTVLGRLLMDLLEPLLGEEEETKEERGGGEKKKKKEVDPTPTFSSVAVILSEDDPLLPVWKACFPKCCLVVAAEECSNNSDGGAMWWRPLLARSLREFLFYRTRRGPLEKTRSSDSDSDAQNQAPPLLPSPSLTMQLWQQFQMLRIALRAVQKDALLLNWSELQRLVLESDHCTSQLPLPLVGGQQAPSSSGGVVPALVDGLTAVANFLMFSPSTNVNFLLDQHAREKLHPISRVALDGSFATKASTTTGDYQLINYSAVEGQQHFIWDSVYSKEATGLHSERNNSEGRSSSNSSSLFCHLVLHQLQGRADPYIKLDITSSWSPALQFGIIAFVHSRSMFVPVVVADEETEDRGYPQLNHGILRALQAAEKSFKDSGSKFQDPKQGGLIVEPPPFAVNFDVVPELTPQILPQKCYPLTTREIDWSGCVKVVHPEPPRRRAESESTTAAKATASKNAPRAGKAPREFTRCLDGMYGSSGSPVIRKAWNGAHLEGVKLPADIDYLFPDCFKGFGKLQNVNFFELTKLQVIGSWCFYTCALTNVDLANCTALKVLSPKAFTHCTHLVRAELPSQLESIGEQCFQECICLTSVGHFLPATLIECGAQAFDGCACLLHLDFSKCLELRSMQAKVFHRHCYHKTTYDDECGDNEENLPLTIVLPNTLKMIDECAFEGSHVQLLSCRANAGELSSDKWTAPVSLQYLKPHALSRLKLLKRVDLSGCTELIVLSRRVFLGCPLLSFVKLPPKLKMISAECFSQCPSLALVELTESAPNTYALETIKERAFAGCHSLEKGELLKKWKRCCEKLTSIANDAFDER